MQQEQFAVNVPLSKTTPIVCEECGNDTFTQVLYARKVSKFLVGSPEDITKFIPTLSCSKCGHVNKDLSIKTLLQDENSTTD